jgi:DNA-binding transcriptional LysR family regulator
METNRLKQFCTVIETGALRSAAELIGMSHGALSKSLKVLEEELGIDLFLPEGRGIIPTNEAMLVYRKAKNIVSQIEDLSIIEDAPIENKIKIATFEVFSTYFLNRLMPLLKNYKLDLYETRQAELENFVSSKLVDFGITYEPIPTSGVDFLKVTSVTMSVFATKTKFNDEEFESIPFVAPIQPVKGAPSGVKGLDGWPEHKFPRLIQHRVDTLESAIELTREGLCAIYLPRFIAEIHNKFVKENYKLYEKQLSIGFKPVKRDVYIVKPKSSKESIEMRKIAKWLRSLN